MFQRKIMSWRFCLRAVCFLFLVQIKSHPNSLNHQGLSVQHLPPTFRSCLWCPYYIFQKCSVSLNSKRKVKPFVISSSQWIAHINALIFSHADQIYKNSSLLQRMPELPLRLPHKHIWVHLINFLPSITEFPLRWASCKIIVDGAQGISAPPI